MGLGRRPVRPPDLLQRCIEALDARPEIVLAHSWTAFIDETGQSLGVQEYRLVTDVPSPSERFRNLLHAVGGDDIYGVIRTEVMQRIRPHGSYRLADHVIVAELSLNGRIHQVPEPLYFRRDHPGRAERAGPGVRQRCVRLDPRRRNRWLHPVLRLLVEYIGAYLVVIVRSPIGRPEKLRCTRDPIVWALERLDPRRSRRLLNCLDPAVRVRAEQSALTRLTRRLGPGRSGPEIGGGTGPRWPHRRRRGRRSGGSPATDSPAAATSATTPRWRPCWPGSGNGTRNWS